MPDLAIAPPYEAAIIAICKTIDTCVTARMDYLRMLSDEQRATVFDREAKGQQVAFDIFVQPLIGLVDLIKGAGR